MQISNKISLKFVTEGPVNNIPALVEIMACRRPGDQELYLPFTHLFVISLICVANHVKIMLCNVYMYKVLKEAFVSPESLLDQVNPVHNSSNDRNWMPAHGAVGEDLWFNRQQMALVNTLIQLAVKK